MIKVTKIINQKKYAQAVQEYIEENFELYGLSYEAYFDLYDAESDSGEKISCYDSRWNLDEGMISYAATLLGITKNDIYSCNPKVVEKWSKKYPFFNLILDIGYANRWSPLIDIDKIIDNTRKEDETAEQHLLRMLFREYESAFDRESIKKRLVDFLKEASAIDPELFHEGQEIVNLNISTVVVEHYPQLGELLTAYFETITAFQRLFNKALINDLNEEEAREFNFLSSALGAYDIYCSITKSFLYKDVVNRRQVYKKENVTDFFETGSFYKKINPWRFAEFVEDREIAQKYIDLFPSSKHEMIQFVNQAAFFNCFFWWEDEDKKRLNYVERHPFENDWESIMTEDDMDMDFAPTEVNIPKTEEELFGEEESIEKLKRLARSEKLGGLIKRKEKNISAIERFNRFQERMPYLREKSYFESRSAGRWNI